LETFIKEELHLPDIV